MCSYDIIVFGASGFTGQFVVEEIGHIANQVNGLKFAIAGRNRQKLETVLKNAEKNTHLDFSKIDIILADVQDQESLIAMAKKTKVLINCVGPYRYYGMKIVEACIKGGADHVDISGEPQYLEQVQMTFSEEAESKGVHIIGSCGFDSVPADLGTVFLQDNFGGDVNSVEMIVGFSDDSKGNAPINVTTLECALHGYAARKELGKIRKEIFKQKTPKSNYKAEQRGTVWWNEESKRWCVPNLASDRSVVLRTQNLNYQLHQRRPLQFNAFFGIRSLFTVFGSMVFGLIFAAMASFTFTRNLFLKFPALFSFGAFSRNGAKRDDLKDMKFCITFVGRGWDTTLLLAEEQHSGPPNVQKVARVTGPDPGYFGTAAIVVQCALTVLQEKEKLPKKGGVFTPGSAFLATSLKERLQSKKIRFEIID